MPPITPEIISGLAQNDDFGFEMRVGRELRAIDFTQIRHGDSYVDPRTEKERTFDYQCSFTSEWRKLQLAIECKNLFPNSPAVICGHNRIEGESFHEVIYAGQGILRGKQKGDHVQTGGVSEVIRVGPNSELYPFQDAAKTFVGKSVFRPKPPSKEKTTQTLAKLPFDGYSIQQDDDYDRWNQANGSAAAFALKAFEYGNTLEGRAGIVSLTLPMFVIPDETLWQVCFDENGAVVGAPELAEHVTLYRDQRISRNQHYGTPFYRTTIMSHVHFFTLTGLKKWLALVNDRKSSFWASAFPMDLIQAVTGRFTPYRG